MADNGRQLPQRAQDILAELLKHLLAESVTNVERGLDGWRAGSLDVLEVHAEIVRHVARAELIATQIAQSTPDDLPALLRAALDAALISLVEFRELVDVAPGDVEPAEFALADTASPHEKRKLVEELLLLGPLLVQVDSTRDDVNVPDHLKDDVRLILRFGYSLTPAIVDLIVDDTGVSGTLSFGGVPHRCVLPWRAIYGVVVEGQEKGMVWPDHVPPEVMQAGDPPPSQPSEPVKPKRPTHLKLVD